MSIATLTQSALARVGKKGKEIQPFIVKMIYFNLLVDMAKIFRAYTLYPELNATAIKTAPQFVVCYHSVMHGEPLSAKEKRSYTKAAGTLPPAFETIRAALEKHKSLKNYASQFVAKKAMRYNGLEASALPLFLHFYQAYLNEHHLIGIKDKLLFPKGNQQPATSGNDYQLDNLFLGPTLEAKTKVDRFDDFTFVNDEHGIRSPSWMATTVFECKNIFNREEGPDSVMARKNMVYKFGRKYKSVYKKEFMMYIDIRVPKKKDDNNKKKGGPKTPSPSKSNEEDAQSDQNINTDLTIALSVATSRKDKTTVQQATTPTQQQTPNNKNSINKWATPLMKKLREAQKNNIAGLEDGPALLQALLDQLGQPPPTNDTNPAPQTPKINPPPRDDPGDRDEVIESLTDLFADQDPDLVEARVLSAYEYNPTQVITAFGFDKKGDISFDSDKMVIIKTNQMKLIKDTIGLPEKQQSYFVQHLHDIFKDAKESGWNISLDFKSAQNDDTIIAIIAPSILWQIHNMSENEDAKQQTSNQQNNTSKEGQSNENNTSKEKQKKQIPGPLGDWVQDGAIRHATAVAVMRNIQGTGTRKKDDKEKTENKRGTEEAGVGTPTGGKKQRVAQKGDARAETPKGANKRKGAKKGGTTSKTTTRSTAK